MSSSPSARALLAQADEQRRLAAGADDLMRDMRLGYAPAMKQGILARLIGRYGYREPEWVPVDRDVAAAIYEAAAIVKADALLGARQLEARVTTEAGK